MVILMKLLYPLGAVDLNNLNTINHACSWPGKSMFLCLVFLSVIFIKSPAPRAINSSLAVYRPLFLMIPPTLPRPSSISVFSYKVTSAPAFLAVMAAAHGVHLKFPLYTYMIIEYTLMISYDTFNPIYH